MMEPVRAPERIEVIDILRGIAIFGILLVNMPFFNSSFFFSLTDVVQWPEVGDQLVKNMIHFFAESKFYSLFSFLFGLGFSIQMTRAAKKSSSFGRFFSRRLLILLVIGQLHAHLLWNGDILTIYAVVGFALLLFRKRSPRTLIIWAVILIMIPVMFQVAMTTLMELGRLDPQAAQEIEKALSQAVVQYEELAENASEVYSSGSYGEIMQTRRSELWFFYMICLFAVIPNVLAMFLLGLYVGRQEIHIHVSANLPLIRRVLIAGLIIGVPTNIIYTLCSNLGNPVDSPRLALASGLAIAAGAPALCLVYLSFITLLVQGESWKKRLSPIAAVGRMALSNYLLHSVVCTTLFYSYGFGLFGKVSPAQGLLLTIAIYILQIPFSVWWLKHFRFGPMEWLWRSCTYGKIQGMRLEP